MLDAFVYQYAVALAIFGAGIAAGIRTGALSPKTTRGRRRLLWLVAGMLFLMALQGSFLIWGK